MKDQTMAEFWDPAEPPRGPVTPPAQAETGQRKRRTKPAPLPEPSESTPDIPVPPMDADIAAQLAQLLAAGLSDEQAVRYVVPDVTGLPLARLTKKWLRSSLVRDAVNTLNAGAWHTLSDDQRISIALTKHRAECAYFLYTHELEAASAGELAKIEMAREVLEKFTQGGIDPTDPLAAFARAAKDIMATALGPTPAQLAGSTVDYRDAPKLGRIRDDDDVLN